MWSSKAVTRIFHYSSRYISIISSNKTNRVPSATSWIFFLFIRSCCKFRKRISLVKEFVLVNSFIGFLWEIFRKFSQQLPRKTPLIFGISSIILSICCCHLVVYYPTKRLWNYVSASQICCSGCCSLLCHCQYDLICREF